MNITLGIRLIVCSDRVPIPPQIPYNSIWYIQLTMLVKQPYYIQTKMHNVYGKMTMYDHLSIQSTHPQDTIIVDRIIFKTLIQQTMLQRGQCVNRTIHQILLKTILNLNNLALHLTF